MIQVQVDASVFENSYEQGKGEYVNAWTDVVEFHDVTPKEAVEQMFSNNVGYELDWKHIGIDDEYSNCFDYSVMVDKDNREASQGEIESWKEGTMKLYVANLRVTVTHYKPTPTSMDNIRKGVVEDAITSKMIGDKAQEVFDEMYTTEDIMKGNTVEMMKEAREIAIKQLKEA